MQLIFKKNDNNFFLTPSKIVGYIVLLRDFLKKRIYVLK